MASRSLFQDNAQWERRRVPAKPKKPGGKQKGKVKRTAEEQKQLTFAMSLGSLHGKTAFQAEHWSEPGIRPSSVVSVSVQSVIEDAKAAKQSAKDIAELVIPEEDIEDIEAELEGFVPLKPNQGRHAIPSTAKHGILVDRWIDESQAADYPSMIAMIKAAEVFEKELAEAEEIADIERIFTLQCKLGMACAKVNVDDSVSWLEKAFHSANLVEDDFKKWTVFSNMATMYAMQNYREKVVAYDEKALEIAITMGSLSLEAISWFNLGSSYHLMNYLRKANKFYLMSKRILEKIQAPEKLAAIETNIAVVKIYVKRAQQRKEEEEAQRQKELNKLKRQQAGK